MAKTDPNRIAAHEGVGVRAVELGYRRKNERVYEKEAGDLTLSISFYFNGDDRFADESGVRSKKIEDLMDAADLAKSQYTNNRGRKAHVAKSAIWSWSDENWQGLRAYKEAQRKKWPIAGAFFDWDKRWDRQSPYVLSPYIDKGLWQAVPDAPGCAEISLARWTETIEPWLEAMRDPKNFASWYHRTDGMGANDLHRAVVWTAVGETKYAAKLIRAEYAHKCRSVEEIYEVLNSKVRLNPWLKADGGVWEAAKEVFNSYADGRVFIRNVADVLKVTLPDDDAPLK